MLSESGKGKLINRSFSLSLLISLTIVLWYSSHYNHELFNFSRRMIGIATLEKIDISYRVLFFYKVVILFTSVFFVTNYIFEKIPQKIKESREWLISNTLALLCFLLMLVSFFQADTKASFQLVWVLVPAPVLWLLYREKFLQTEMPGNFWGWLFLSSFIPVFGIQECTSFFSISSFDLFSLYLISFYVLFVLFIAVKDFGIQQRIILASFPLAFIPISVTLSDEIYLILNQRGIHFASSDLFSIVFFSTSVAIAIGVYFKAKINKFTQERLSRWIAYFHIPVILLGLLLFAYYKPLHEFNPELFENANPSLGIQRYFLWNELPLLESFNSHMFQELIPGFIYVFLNGEVGPEMFLYNFLNLIGAYLLLYFLLAKVLNPYAAFAAVLLIPNVFIHPNTCWALLGVIAIIHLCKKESVMRYFIVTLVAGCLFLYKIDIGLAGFYALLITYIIIRIRLKEKPDWKALGTGILCGAAVFVIPVVIVSYLKEIPLWEQFLQAFHYTDSAQTYGYTDIANERSRSFYIQYYLFPFFAIALIICLVTGFVKYYRQDKYLLITLIFFAVFYLANFQRGLVRHSLIEGTDNFFSSFIYMIIPLAFCLFAGQYLSNNVKWIIAGAFTFFVPYLFKFPAFAESSNIFSVVDTKFGNFPAAVSYSEKISRVYTESGEPVMMFKEFRRFLDENYPDKRITFFDFSNTPMLYYYTERKVPVYFNQTLLTVHDDYLQDKTIEQIKKNEVPVIVFSHEQEGYWDNVDKVPNTVRHYRIAEFIFQNYQPLGIIDGFNIWVDKTISPRPFDSLRPSGDWFRNYELRYLPYVWANYDRKQIKSAIQASWAGYPENGYQIADLDKQEGNYLVLKVSAKDTVTNVSCKVSYGIGDDEKGVYTFAIDKNPGKSDYKIRLSMQYNWFSLMNDKIRVSFFKDGQLTDEVKILGAQITKGD